jgi:transcriptional regulator with XRE-family HTH domain
MSEQQAPIGELLRTLRRRASLSLRDVAEQTDGAISNAYLSQIERGHRSAPNPRILARLAKLYGVSAEELLERAGYTSAPAVSDVDIAFEQVLVDRSFRFGTRFPGELNEDAKRMFIELYEKATGKKLLRNQDE